MLLKFQKMDYTEHEDAKKLRLEKVVEHIPDWYKEWEKEKTQEPPFSHLGQDNEASISLPPKSSTDEACEEPLAVDAKPKRKPGKKTESRQGVTRVEDLFVRKEVEADDN